MATAGLSLKLVLGPPEVQSHAAGGLARSHAQALWLLRAAEDLCRRAVAVLPADASIVKKTNGMGKDKDKKDTGNGNVKDSDVGTGVKHKEPGAQPGRRRRGRASVAAAAAVSVSEFDDSWADGVGGATLSSTARTSSSRPCRRKRWSTS